MSDDYEEQQYNDTIDETELNNLITRVQTAEARNAQLSQANSMVGSGSKTDNFLHLQISTEKMLERLEHFYAGDYEGYDDEGNKVWKKQDDDKLITFNKFGVASLMEIVTKYIDKNTSLSYYDSQRIYEILADIGDELTLFMLCNYEQIGMDTYFKKTKFRLVIATTLHIIESSYRRALGGRTLEELNQSKVVGQFGNLPLQHTAPVAKHPGRIAKFFGGR